MNEAYGSFAYAYDQVLGRRFFQAVRTLLRRSLHRYQGRERTHLDLACGTALAVEFFAARGYRSVGVDLSLPMLRIGRGRARHLIGGDIRALPLRARFGWVTCLYDSLNHLKSGNDLVAAFRSVASVMVEEGLFLFDMNHPDIYPAIWGNDQPFVAEGEGFHLKMATTFRARDRIARAVVTGWADVEGTRVKIHERREQRAYSEREVLEALTTSGLVPVEMTEFDPFAEARKVKLFFVCRRV